MLKFNPNENYAHTNFPCKEVWDISHDMGSKERHSHHSNIWPIKGHTGAL